VAVAVVVMELTHLLVVAVVVQLHLRSQLVVRLLLLDKVMQVAMVLVQALREAAEAGAVRQQRVLLELLLLAGLAGLVRLHL
jgi:hypothetical protein